MSLLNIAKGHKHKVHYTKYTHKAQYTTLQSVYSENYKRKPQAATGFLIATSKWGVSYHDEPICKQTRDKIEMLQQTTCFIIANNYHISHYNCYSRFNI